LAVAGLSLAYLAYLGVRPNAPAKRADRGNVELELAAARRDMARAFADLDPLRQSVGEIKMDVANLKSAAQEATHRDSVLLERVSALESAAQGGAPVREAARETAPSPLAIPPAPKPDPRKSTTLKTTKTDAPPAATALPQPPKPSALNRATRTSETIDTGSIERPAKAAAPPTKPQPIGLLLATGPSVDALRLNWSILSDRHADAVKNLNPRYVMSGTPADRTYDLVAGPIASPEQARTLCREMEKRGLSCTVSAYRGNAL
jgi:hypothetical protein